MAETIEKNPDYRVLARKYRPQNFDELIGQDALVQTLKNAIDSNRIAHAYMLTGIRGTGKTTSARIIAKALNYTGADGTSGPTTGDTSDCAICQAIAQDRHPDVMEMDAASRTGIDDIREILDGVRYAPVSARYKIYIIDEVHMLSKQAFNALLKTLEEPPSHVKFIFATTEIRKVPVTILSRCQRFDLKRVDVPVLKNHFASICSKENVSPDDEALNLIAQAADGSVRDGLSLLDQAIALGNGEMVKTDDVATMLGATDRIKILDLVESGIGGNPSKSLEIMHELYRMGAMPAVIIQDMMDILHGLSIYCATKTVTGIESLPHSAIDRAKNMASQLTMPQLQKSWQILLKGLEELHHAPNPQKSAEMIILRLIYAADLPDPTDILRKIKDGKIQVDASPQSHSTSISPDNAQPKLRAVAGGYASSSAIPQVIQVSENQVEYSKNPETFNEMIALFEEKGEMLLASNLYHDVACISIKTGHFEFTSFANAPADLASRVRTHLKNWTGHNWMVSVMNNPNGLMSLAQLKVVEKDEQVNKLKSNPNIKAVLDVFPDAEIVKIFNHTQEE